MLGKGSATEPHPSPGVVLPSGTQGTVSSRSWPSVLSQSPSLVGGTQGMAVEPRKAQDLILKPSLPVLRQGGHTPVSVCLPVPNGAVSTSCDQWLSANSLGAAQWWCLRQARFHPQHPGRSRLILRPALFSPESKTFTSTSISPHAPDPSGSSGPSIVSQPWHCVTLATPPSQ